MNFLAPLFLIAGAAIVGPLIYHLIRRSTRDRTTFSSLMFLLPSPPRISKRHRLQHLLLLLLRCLALLLLALAFARPFMRETSLDDSGAGEAKRTVVLVDTSASMRRTGVWAAALQRAEEVLREAAPTDQVALYAFDRRPTALVSFEEWNRAAPGDRLALAVSRLQAVEPTWAATQLGTALIAAAEALAEHEVKDAVAGPREVVVVSDLQAGSRLDTLQAYEWPQAVALRVEPVKPRVATNAGLQWVAEAADANRASEAIVRVRVTNAPDAQREQFKIGWARGEGNEFVGTPIDLYVPPGQSRVIVLPAAKETPGLNRIVLRGDDEPFDNVVHVIPPLQQRVEVLWLGRDTGENVREPLFFLRRALGDTPRIDVEIEASPSPTADASRRANLLLVRDPLSPEATNSVRQAIEAGKTVVAVPSSAEFAPSLAALVGQPNVVLADARPSSYAMLAEIDFRHPLFAPFSDPRFSDFTKIHVWKYRKLDATAIPGTRVIASFDSGDPAVVEIPLGQGRLFVLLTGWHPDDSQLAVSTKFVPLLWSLLELGQGVATGTSQFFVGDAVPRPSVAGDVSVRTPTGEVVALTADASRFEQATQPGVYAFVAGEQTQRFAVNVDANESRTAPLSLDELERLGLPIAKSDAKTGVTAAERAQLQASEAENRQKLWRWFIAATLLVLLIESAVAGWTARRGGLQGAEVAS